MIKLPAVTSSRRVALDERAAAAELCTLLLREYHRLKEAGRLTRALRHQLWELIDTTLWKFSEAAGKIHGCHYWSAGAIASYQKYGRITRKRDSATEMLQHEHLIPKRELVGHLLRIEPLTREEVQAFLDSYDIGVVVTKEEHDRLSPRGTPDDPWARYRDAGVAWVDWRKGD
jgi:hypothetical protein